MTKFKGSRALITGASRGIGRSIALAFAREGAEVIITGRAVPELTAVRDEIVGQGGTATMIVADLAAADGVEQIFSQLDSDPIHILVNNAGIGSSADPKPLVNFNDAFWQETLWVNLSVPYLLCKKVV